MELRKNYEKLGDNPKAHEIISFINQIMKYVKLVRSRYHPKFDPNDFRDEIEFNKHWFAINPHQKIRKFDYFFGPYTEPFNWMRCQNQQPLSQTRSTN